MCSHNARHNILQIIKRILEGSNYYNPTKRVCTFWNVKSARDLTSFITATWGHTAALRFEEVLLLSRSKSTGLVKSVLEVMRCASKEELPFSIVHKLHHCGDDYHADQTWVLCQEYTPGARHDSK
jgi:hypothetical protein